MPHSAVSDAAPTEGLSLVDLACRRGGRMVFAGLTAHVKRGTALVLRGPNGSGKSSLLRTIAGLTPRAMGTVALDGAVPDGQIAYAGHLDGLKAALTLRDNMAPTGPILSGQRLSGAALRAAAVAFDLAKLLDRETRYFSAGQRHRASLMRLILAGKPLWLMDEPTVGLDAAARAKLFKVMRDHLASGGLIVAATHEAIDVPALSLDLGDYALAQLNEDAFDALEEGW